MRARKKTEWKQDQYKISYFFRQLSGFVFNVAKDMYTSPRTRT